ncbi:MAG TPA: IclR family transcriptional regulator C-terminal domain-containing protein [Mycobacterium sp.]
MTSKLSAILLVLCDGGEHTLTEIAGSTNLPTSTSHRLILQMLAWRLVERSEDRSYRISFPVRMIASDYSTPEASVYAHTVMRALPVLNELSAATRYPARIGILRGSDVFTLQPPPNMPTDRVHAEGFLHTVTPAHAAASGKALLAFSPAGVVDHLIAAGLSTHTRRTITSPEILRRNLSMIRVTQIATSRHEFESDRSAIACPIFHGGGRVAAAIELSARDLGRELKPAASALWVACRSLSRQLVTDFHLVGP